MFMKLITLKKNEAKTKTTLKFEKKKSQKKCITYCFK